MTREELNKAELLETLTTVVTAFGSWNDFRAAMQSGYVPTIRPVKLTRRSSINEKSRAKAHDMLAVMVRAEGFRVFDGNRVS